MPSSGQISRASQPEESATTSAPQRLRVEYWPVEKLRAYERNPRRNDKAVEQIRASIREYGFAVPILAKFDGEVIDGHLRLKGAIAEKMREVPVVPCDGWTDAQVRAFRLMVNRSVSWADWDPDALVLEFAELKALDFDLRQYNWCVGIPAKPNTVRRFGLKLFGFIPDHWPDSSRI